MKPTWLITDPTEPPFPGGSSPKFRLTLAPENLTPSAVPRVTPVPPIATKIFLLAATSCETRCQWPMVTPASLNGACCATAVPATVDASHNPAIKFFMNASLLRHRLLIGGCPDSEVRIISRHPLDGPDNLPGYRELRSASNYLINEIPERGL